MDELGEMNEYGFRPQSHWGKSPYSTAMVRYAGNGKRYQHYDESVVPDSLTPLPAGAPVPYGCMY